MMERRVFRGQVRAKDGDQPGIDGVASVYNQDYDTGYFTETILPGAFDDVMGTDPDVRSLFNHDPNNLLGRTKSGTLRLADASDGLHYSVDMDPKSTLHADVHRMVKRGDLDGSSFSFEVGDDDWQTERDANGKVTRERRVIKRIAQLFDVGPVTFPAYTGTSVGARSLWPQGVPAEVRSHVLALRADEKKTKRVDGEDLTADCFLIVGDPEKTETWKLPWKFSTDDKTKSHLRNAVARFDQLDDVSEDVKKNAWNKLMRLCEEYGVDVSDDVKKKYSARAADDDAAKLEAAQAAAKAIKVDCEEILDAVAVAVADPASALKTIADELGEIARKATAAAGQFAGAGSEGGETEDEDERMRMRLRVAQASL